MEPKKTTKTPRVKKPSPAQILKEQHIAMYQEQIAQDKETIAKLEKERSAIIETDVIGLSVSHKHFGNGTVIGQSHSSITVKFDLGDKCFLMPSAFVDGFLEAERVEINETFIQYRELDREIKLLTEEMSAAARSIQALEKR